MDPLLPRALGSLGDDRLLVHELFASIQGEGTHAGCPCFFIRLTGCHLRCTWCDTQYAFHEGREYSVEECVDRAVHAGQRLVEVTGGEPLLQKAVYRLLSTLCDRGFEVLLETSGAIPIDRVDPRVRRIVDWKCPGSGMAGRNRPDVLRALRDDDELKLVLRDRGDFEWAKAFLARERASFARGVVVHVSAVWGSLEPSTLARWIVEERVPARLSLQLHKWLFGADARGV